MAGRLDQTLAALADPTRLAVVRMLREGARRPSDIAEELSVSRPAVSRHLRVLRRAGLIENVIHEEDARVRVYRLRRERFSELREWLGEVESFWSDQLGAFKAHAERGRRRR